MTASPGPIPQAMSTSRSASVPLEQVITWRAPQNAASSLSSARTSGPRMNWQCVKYARHGIVDGAAEAPALRGNIDERDRPFVDTGELIHGAIFTRILVGA